MDTNQTFEAAGLVVFTDMNISVIPDQIICNESLGVGRCPNGQCYEFKRECDGVIDCLDGYDEVACPNKNPPKVREPAWRTMLRASNVYPDTQWAWITSWVKPQGQVETQMPCPSDSTDIFVFHAFVLHPTEGMSIAAEVAQYEATPFFFMVVENPTDIRRGEQIGLQLSLHNNWDEELWAVVTLQDSDDYRFVYVEDFGYASSYAPRTGRGDFMTMVRITVGKPKYLYFPIVPTKYEGSFTVKINAFTPVQSDSEEVTMSISLDGVTNDDSTPYLIDLVNQGSIIIPDFDINIPEMFFHPERREHLYVPESRTAQMSVFGDVVSPGFFNGYYDTSTMCGIPDDSCEGYMTDFAYNLQTLKYLQATNALSREAQEGAVTYMRSIIMRQFAYMQDDHSFKQFRRSSNSSVWVTAYVFRTLYQTLESEWNENIYIDVDILNKIAQWIADQQLVATGDPTTAGRWKETGPTYDKKMEPWTYPDPEDKSNKLELDIPLTAYVLICISGNSRLTGQARSATESAKQLASEYLANQMTKITDPFQMTLVAYALQTSGHRQKDDAYILMKDMKRESDGVYWSDRDIEPNPTEVVNTVHFMKPRPDMENVGYTVQATSYALMLYLSHNEFEQSKPIMRFIQTQRNTMIGWSSTQDTLVALQALTEYALRETNRFIYQMEITLESTSSPGWRQTYRLNSSNFADLYSAEVPIAYGQVKAYAQGTGYAVMQLYSTFNVEKEFQVEESPFKPGYDIFVENIFFTGRNASIMSMHLCARWARPDISDFARQTVMTIAIPTGFVVSRDNINKLYYAGIPGLKRVRFRDKSLIIFFEYMEQRRTCLHVQADRWFPVANVSIQHAITVYDYFETGLYRVQLYTVYTLFHQHICFVCGSFQCPYCYYYNAVSPSVASWPVLLLGVLLAVWLPYLQRGTNEQSTDYT